MGWSKAESLASSLVPTTTFLFSKSTRAIIHGAYVLIHTSNVAALAKDGGVFHLQSSNYCLVGVDCCIPCCYEVPRCLVSEALVIHARYAGMVLS